MRFAPLAFVLALMVPVLLAPTPAASSPAVLSSSDPTLPGPYAHAEDPYSLGSVTTGGSALPVRGQVYYPLAGGTFPLVVFIHGNHGTCDVAGTHVPWWRSTSPNLRCRSTPVTAPIENAKGYDYVATHLAGHGFVVLSLDVNGLNENPQVPDPITSRVDVLFATLDRLASPPPGATLPAALPGAIDWTRIGLAGHSRGGGAVARAVTDARASAYDFQAVFGIAPVFAPGVPGVHYATLLPYCDGDVYSLSGAYTFDDSRAFPGDAGVKYQFLAMGSNHNHYSTRWTNDDWTSPVLSALDPLRALDPECGYPAMPPLGTARLSPEDQRRHGLGLMSAFFRLHLAGESVFADWLQRGAATPAGACPGGVGPCPGIVHVSYHPVAADRLVVEDGHMPAGVNDLGGASPTPAPPADGCVGASQLPLSRPDSVGLEGVPVCWDGPATWRLAIPTGQGDVRAFDAFAFRAGVEAWAPRNAPYAEQDFELVLEDGNGTRASTQVGAHTDALYAPPGEQSAKRVLNQVRVPLSAFAGVDLSDVAAIELRFGVTPEGSVDFADLMFLR